MNADNSPFKFLDAYSQGDEDIFFGRDKETSQLYNALSGVKHLLVYGPSGAGKTSLIECGLRNQFSDVDWYALTIRRGDHIVASVYREINEALQKKIILKEDTGLPEDESMTFGETIEQLFAEKYQPVYLLFDQFEELLILGSEDEKIDFFTRLNDLIKYKVPCRVILIMREEFIGHLSEFEYLCPNIFHHRFRLEKMGRTNVQEVILNILEAERYSAFFDVEEPEALTGHILAKLPDNKREIELTHVQVFLSELWERATVEKQNNSIPTIHEGLIKEEDNLESVLDSFLKGQLVDLGKEYGEKVSLELLAAMITERHTKLQLSESELLKDLGDKGVSLHKPVQELLEALIQRRIIRPLKANNNTQYEISHDLLALVVGQNLTEEMKMREKAEDVYKVYQERQGYFSSEDIDYIRPYKQYKAYPSALKKRIEESTDHLKSEQERELKEAEARVKKEQELRGKAEQSKKRAVQRTWIASAIAIMTIGVATAAFYFFQDAQQQKVEVQAQKKLAEKRQKEAERLLIENTLKDSLNRVAQFNRFWSDAERLKSIGAYTQAISRYRDARAFTTDTLKIDQAIASCNNAAGNEQQSTSLLAKAKIQLEQQRYGEAIKTYNSVIQLGVDISTVKNELTELKAKLNIEMGQQKELMKALDYDKAKAKSYEVEVNKLERLISKIQNLLNSI